MYKITFTAQGLIELEVEKKIEARIVHETLNKAGLDNIVVISEKVEFPVVTE
jgi:hypothetical protein